MKKIKSYAKINASLNVLGKLKNNLHKIETLFFFVDLHDEIYISETNGSDHKVVFVGKFSNGIGKNNTINKLLNVLENHNLLKKKYSIKIVKKIPSKSGLGGGSMNAASLLNHFIRNKIVKLNKQKIFDICKIVGSDVILGLDKELKSYNKRNNIYKLRGNLNIKCILIKPNFGCSTKDIYKNVKLFNKPKFRGSNFNYFTLKKMRLLNNDLQKIAFEKYPKLKKIQKNLEKCKGLFFSRMTGSGSCIVGYFTSRISCLNALKLLKKKYKRYWCIETKVI